MVQLVNEGGSSGSSSISSSSRAGGVRVGVVLVLVVAGVELFHQAANDKATPLAKLCPTAPYHTTISANTAYSSSSEVAADCCFCRPHHEYTTGMQTTAIA